MQVSCVSLHTMYESGVCVCMYMCTQLCKHADVLMYVLSLYFYLRILMCMQAAMLV